MISRKVILTGSFGVGKTSLFRRFINNTFSEKYITTIGVKVDKRTVEINGAEVSILLWDIAGEVKQDKVPKSYFLGASAIIYVFDLTRPSTYKNIKLDMDILRDVLPDAIIKIVANKEDLVAAAAIEKVKESLPFPIDVVTSAKTGKNVEPLFFDLAKDFIG
ncbi:MAG: Rab family GTPase [Bacteroidota bacterium]